MPKHDHSNTLTREIRFAKSSLGDLPKAALKSLSNLISRHAVSVADGDLKYLNNGWYVTHSGLLRLAERRHCAGMHVRPVLKSCDPPNSRRVFRAVVFKSRSCKGFVGWGDAALSNTSDLVRGAEMRVAETRAVNRALRKDYCIGICSVDEIGSFSGPPVAEEVNGNGTSGKRRLRDHLCRLIRKHQLDPVLVKSYAMDYRGVGALNYASREQVEGFIEHVADWATKDKNALLCQLNCYLARKAGAA